MARKAEGKKAERCAMDSSWHCGHKFYSKRAGKVLYIPDVKDTARACPSCYNRLLKKGFIKKVHGITLGKWL